MAGANGTGFNADARAKDRESGPITIGGSTYHPRRLTNARLRDIRRLARSAGRDARAAARASEEYKEAYDEIISEAEGPEGEKLEGDELEKYARRVALEAGMSSDEAVAINNESLRQQLHLLLVDDSMVPIPVERVAEHLDEDLDTRDIEGLMTHLLGQPDPTETEKAEATT